MGGSKGGRDMASRHSKDGAELKLTSRHGCQCGRSRHGNDVAT